MAAYEDFALLDIRVAEVKEVERVPGSEKLYKLRVDIGEEMRTVVAGVNAEGLRGKKVIIIANLEPREIMGIKSEGMLLGVDGGGLLVPDRDVRPGATIR